MDNLTHSLVGVWCAEAVVRGAERRRPLESWTRTGLYVLGIVGNNAPDCDFTYSNVSGKTFGYLLQHRGYTHTLPAVLGFGLLLLGLLAFVAKVGKQAPPRGDWPLLALVAFASPLLHIVMDFANNYGVHPFWPLYDGWFYGDSFFILEPSFWLVLIAPLAWSYRSKWLRWSLWGLLGLAAGALWYRPFVPPGIALFFTALTAGLLWVGRRMSERARFALASAGFLLVALAFIAGSRATKARIRAYAAVTEPSARTLDVVATPMPANPLCWGVQLVQLAADGTYRVSIGRSAVLPALLDVDACPYDRNSNPTAPVERLPRDGNRALRFSGRYRVPVSELRALGRERCEASAFYRFARVPYLAGETNAGTLIIGDIRYDRSPGLDFSDIALSRIQGRCPEHVPSWLPPRSDILSDSNSPNLD